MIITFGKYKGYDTEKLAQFSEGRKYLKWGMDNLSSPQWQKEFKRVLELPLIIDIEAEAQSIMSGDAQIEPRDAYNLADEYAEQTKKEYNQDKAYKQAKEELRQELLASGSSLQSVNALMNIVRSGWVEDLEEAEKYKRAQFSSLERREAAYKAFANYQKKINEIF
jgi:hypothetical protein